MYRFFRKIGNSYFELHSKVLQKTLIETYQEQFFGENKKKI